MAEDAALERLGAGATVETLCPARGVAPDVGEAKEEAKAGEETLRFKETDPFAGRDD